MLVYTSYMKSIVVGELHTDIVASGIKKFPEAGQLVQAEQLQINPGGKSPNVARMMAALSLEDSVAMVSRTTDDPYGLGQIPLLALQQSGVNTDHVVVAKYNNVLPGIALIPVDVKGNNQIIVASGVSTDFSPEDIDSAAPLFESVGKNTGLLALTMECPINTAVRSVQLAAEHGLKVMFDPGGINSAADAAQIIDAGVYLIKPNEHEARILTGVEVVSFETARMAAQMLQAENIQNVLITAGVEGAYLFTENLARHIPVTNLNIDGDEVDETGCGDQTMAALCAFIQDGDDIGQAAEKALLAGTLQFHRAGIRPVTRHEFEEAVRKVKL